MILYVNGDSHTAAAEAVNPHAFAEDDPVLFYMGRAPHPDNLAVSWGRVAATAMKATFRCDAEAASSNDRILRTTQAWLSQTDFDPSEILMIIQWSTWERAEWLIDGRWYQITASGTDDVPHSQRDRYKEFVAGVDWQARTKRWHDRIWQWHLDLDTQGIRHVFFNGNNHFGTIPESDRQDWGSAYIGPYDAAQTWDQWLRGNGYETVASNSWHFGRHAHAAWARFMLQYIISHKLLR